MDYTRAPLIFRARKVLRYARLYGPTRTLVKVRGQYHMRATGPAKGDLPAPARADAHVGLIGCGNFAYSHIAHFLHRRHPGAIRGAMDLEGARAASLARRYRAHYATDDADRILDDPDIDLVYVASNHASHADYACRALERGKAVHVEKPHAVTDEQLERLCDTMAATGGRVTLGFNRPDSRLGRTAAELISGQPGTMMLNWFVAGHEIPPDHWYYRPEEGGRVLGNLCHWTDFVLRLVPPENRFPIAVHPVRAQSADTDIVANFVFGDGSIAAITFSAKGHAFEGVKERFSAHRGDLLLHLADFKELRAEVGDRRIRQRLRHRDHGHEASILRGYAMSGPGGAAPGLDVAYVWETGRLFLATRQALEEGAVTTVGGYAGRRSANVA